MLHNKLSKVNIIKIITIILLMLTSVTLLQKAYTIQTYAEITEEDDDNYNDEEKKSSGGVHSSKTGFVCYVATEEGVLKSPVVACFPNQSPPGGELSSRVGGASPSRVLTHVPWVPNTPWGDGGTANGGKIKQWFLEDDGAELRFFVEQKLGVDYNTAVAEGWWLVLEQVSWCTYPNKTSGSPYCGTTWHWGEKLVSLYGASGIGCSTYARYTNAVFEDCMRFDADHCGLVHYSTKDVNGRRYSNGVVATREYALGCMAVRLNNNYIDTYWEPHGSPGDPEPSDPPKDGVFNIVKAYHEKKYVNGVLASDTHVTTTSTLNCIPNINIMDESMCPEGYHLEYWATDSDLNTGITFQGVLAKSGIRHGINATQITMDPKTGEKTVYLSLVKDETEIEDFDDWNYILTESMVTRMIWENHPDREDGMEFLEDEDFTWKSNAHKKVCGGHKCNGHDVANDPNDSSKGTHKEYDTFYCTFGEYKNTDYIDFTLANEYQDNYPDILATKDGTYEIIFANDTHGIEHRHEPILSFDKDKRQTLDEEEWATSDEEDWDYVCILMRGKDKLTVAEWVNNSEAAANDANAEANTFLDGLSSSGFKVANKHDGDRKKSFYKEEFDFYFNDGEGDYSTTWYVTAKAVATCTHGGGPWDCTNTKTYSCEATPMSVHVIVKVDTYSGNPRGGWDDKSVNHSAKITGLPAMPGYASSSNNRVSGRQIQAETISFQPYVLMQYQTLESGASGYPNTYDTHDAGWNKVYVLGQYSRALTPNDYAEISWTYKSSPNLTLFSTQWSTHALATDAWGTSNVLPGGATLGLRIKESDRQKVYVTTYYTYTDGKGKLQCENTGGNPGTMDEATARGDHQAFADSIAQGLENTVVQQWQSDSVHDAYAWDNGIKVNRGESLSGITVSGTKSSEDAKYYFEHGQIGSGRGNYDTKVDPVQFNTFTVYVDTDGSIACAKNNPNMFWGDHSGDYALSALNARTNVVDKLIAALESANAGDDTINGHTEVCFDEKALNGEKWYNEAFDGITIAVEESLVTVGFIDPADRTEVLDPKLTKQQDSKSGQMGMNFGEGDRAGRQSTYELAQFKTRDHSEAWGTFEVEGYFYNNVNGDEVAQDDLEHLFWSRKFWIPNFTVQDIY